LDVSYLRAESAFAGGAPQEVVVLDESLVGAERPSFSGYPSPRIYLLPLTKTGGSDSSSARIGYMSSYGSLRVGEMIVSQLRNSVGDDLLAAFRNDMLKIRQVSEYQYYVVERKFEELDADEVEQVEVLEFRAPGRAIADRLDMTGVNADAIHDFLNQQFSYVDDYTNSPEYLAVFPADIQAKISEDRAYTLTMNAEAWVRGLASSADDSEQPDPSKLGSRTWLLRQLLRRNLAKGLLLTYQALI
jgi:hypothetical protein